jgi:drug/metabolite transporter (DMT)-like permease
MVDESPIGGTRRGTVVGLLSAALFGVSTPLAKLILPGLGPLPLAGLLYLGAGVGLSITPLFRQAGAPKEAPLRRRDIGLLLAVVFFGGLVGPTLLMFGLSRLSAVASSLLLNLEAPLTMLLAVVFFREHLGSHGILASALIVGGAAALGYQPGEFQLDGIGAACVAGACLSWAIDNNLTQRLSLSDPVAVVRIKGLGAGSCLLALSLVTRQKLPSPGLAGAAMLLGSVSYGLSVVLHLRAMRILGAARQAALFATAPFMGAACAVPVLGEHLGLADLAAMVLMATGALLLVRERHGHVHEHEALEHEHLHVHDEHHQHAHEGPVIEPHSHVHRHTALVHDHPHVSDIHHRHRH